MYLPKEYSHKGYKPKNSCLAEATPELQVDNFYSISNEVHSESQADGTITRCRSIKWHDRNGGC